MFVLDLSSAPSLDAISNSISMMVQRGLPIRFGIVPMVSDFANDTSELVERGSFVAADTLYQCLKWPKSSTTP